jgi:hypothetical protein
MPSRRACVTTVAAVLLGACYHATIETGLPPSLQVIDQGFASSWVYGLVPPKTVSAASRCPNGVAKVETELSFLNQLVHILTLGIYTPMHIRVTCAAPASAAIQSLAESQAVAVEPAADTRTIQARFAQAAAEAARTRQTVLVRFDR